MSKGYSGGHLDACRETRKMLGDIGQNQRTRVGESNHLGRQAVEAFHGMHVRQIGPLFLKKNWAWKYQVIVSNAG